MKHEGDNATEGKRTRVRERNKGYSRCLEREERAEDRRWRKEGKDMNETQANSAPMPRTPKKTEGLT